MLAASLALLAIPRSLAATIRLIFGTVLVPGQVVAAEAVAALRGLRDAWQSADLTRREVEELHAEVRRWRHAYVQSQQQVAELHAELGRLRHWSERPPLVTARLVPATLLGRDTTLLLHGLRLLSVGRGAGAVPGALAVDGSTLYIDQGADARLARGQPVFDGLAVVGRIEHVGPYTSSLQLVTDPRFKTLAELQHREDGRVVIGVKGILVGESDGLCRLTRVDRSARVAVGDAVLTTDDQGLLPHALVYGRVLRCELKDHELHWQIWVEPAADLHRLQRVYVVAAELNPARTIGSGTALAAPTATR